MSQSWHVVCHGCRSSASGHATNREKALKAIEDWKSEHRLKHGCATAAMSHSVAGTGVKP